MCKSCFTHRDSSTDFEGIKGLRKVMYAGECFRTGTADGLIGKYLCVSLLRALDNYSYKNCTTVKSHLIGVECFL